MPEAKWFTKTLKHCVLHGDPECQVCHKYDRHWKVSFKNKYKFEPSGWGWSRDWDDADLLLWCSPSMYKLHQPGSMNEKRKPLEMLRRRCKGRRGRLRRHTASLALSRSSTSHWPWWRLTYQVVNHDGVVKPPTQCCTKLRCSHLLQIMLLLARLVFWCTRSGWQGGEEE